MRETVTPIGEALQNLIGDFSQYMGGGGLKMLLKNTWEGVHLIVKLPAKSLQSCNFTKNELHTYFSCREFLRLVFSVYTKVDVQLT